LLKKRREALKKWADHVDLVVTERDNGKCCAMPKRGRPKGVVGKDKERHGIALVTMYRLIDRGCTVMKAAKKAAAIWPEFHWTTLRDIYYAANPSGASESPRQARIRENMEEEAELAIHADRIRQILDGTCQRKKLSVIKILETVFDSG